MKDNTAIVDEVSQTLTGLISIFDMMSALDAPPLRDITLSEFSYFVLHILDNMYQKVNSIKT